MSDKSNSSTSWAVIITASLLFAFAKYIIIALLVSLVLWLGLLANRAHQRKLTAKKARLRGFAYRAEQQNLSHLLGHPYGTYGDYPPV